MSKRHGSRTIINRLSLEIEPGEVLALLGASGSGKTTVLRLVAGLETPDEGEIWIANECVSARGRNFVPPRTRGIGFVFQDLALWPHFTVRGNLDFVLSSSRVPRRERAHRAAEILKLVRIDRFADTYPPLLSGGEQQRAALARALVSRPRLLLLDEPMSSLDASLKDLLIQELANLQRLLGPTTLYVTHDRAEALAIAQRVAFMHEGTIQEIVPAATVQPGRT